MKESTRSSLVGLFVLASLAVLAILMVWFGETPSWLRRGEWTLRITGVRELQGIGEGSPVTLNGVEIGRVSGLEFEDPARPDQGVVVVTRINQMYTVPVGAQAHVYGATLGFGAGRVQIVVQPGRGIQPLPKQDAAIPGQMRSIVGELISKDLVAAVERAVTNIGNLTHEWTPVGTNLAHMFEPRPIADVSAPDAAARGITANLSTAVERIDRLVTHLNNVLGDEAVQGDVKEAVRNLKSASESLRDTMAAWQEDSRRVAENINQGVDRTEEHLDASFTRLQSVLENLDDSSRRLSEVLGRVADGEGTAGLLVRDARLYEAAVLSLQRLSDVMENLLIITGKIRDDGYIVVGQAPSGILRKRFPVPPEPAEPR